MHYGSEQPYVPASNHFSTSSGVNEQINERSGARKRSEQCGASEWMSSASEWVSRVGNGPVLLSEFLIVLDSISDHSSMIFMQPLLLYRVSRIHRSPLYLGAKLQTVLRQNCVQTRRRWRRRRRRSKGNWRFDLGRSGHKWHHLWRHAYPDWLSFRRKRILWGQS